MAILVFVTQKCRAEAATHGCARNLERLVERVEAAQTLLYFEQDFPPPYLVKRGFGIFNGRLIARLYDAGEHQVICLLSMLIRGAPDYDSGFGMDPEAYGKQHFENLFTPKDLEDYVAERTRTRPPPEPPPPSASEYAVLYAIRPATAAGNEVLVCESDRWVQDISEPAAADRLILFQRTILSLLELSGEAALVPVEGAPDWRILARRIPDSPVLFLAGLSSPGKGDADVETLRAKYADCLANSPAHHDILRRSRRTYPSDVLLDNDLWLELEKDRVGNMALSPEETEVLESAERGNGFPLFINGRAGSGKSTILQYLFAHRLYGQLALDEPPDSLPLYFTCSDTLLKRSRYLVERVMRSSARRVGDARRQARLEENQQSIAACFQEFHAYIHGLLLPEEKEKVFHLARRIGYAEYRRRWEERFGRTPGALAEFGPELSWHVIRTYIKGLSPDEFIDPEEYPQLASGQRSVTTEAYRRIFDRVWKGWYEELRSKGWWDDQDLARHLLRQERVRPVASAVFCDEAQDFTRVELEILLRLNVFSARKLKPEDIPEVPFVFAGDPFQTINPTGFRWEDIKAAFTQKFILALDPSLRLRRRELNYRELSLNYRSSQNIVHFSNLIQALRVRLFDLHEARPQRPWEDRCGPVVAWYAVNHPDFWQVFKETNDITLILPCALGEEADTVEKDPVLKAHVTFMEGTPINVLSAERAKGSEFPRVAIYGFGRDAPPNLLRPLEGGSSHTDNRDASLPLEYFLNRLYVAASRPKNQLLVLDPPEHRAFWRFAMDEATQNRLLGELPQSGVGWTDLVTGMVEGNANGLRLAEAPDHEANARNYQEQGLARRDPTFMRNAAFAWRNAGQPMRAAECRARALLFEGRCLDAGNEFRQVGMNDAAVDAWWESGEPGLTRIQREGNADPEIASRVEYRYANFLASSRATVEQGRALLQELLNSARQGETLPYASRPSWAFVIRQTFHKLCDLAPTDGTTAFWADLKVISRGLIEAGFSLGPSDLGNLHYHCHEFADAVECWTRANETSSPEFRRARALSTPFPDNLPLLHALGEDARVADELSAHPKTTLSPEISRIAGVSLTLLVQPEAALPHLLRSRDRDALGQLAIVAHGRGSVAQHAAGAILTLAVIREEWPVVLAFLKSGAIPVPGKTPDSFAKWLISQKSRLEYALARALARSPSLPDLPYTERSDSLVCQKPMAEMLRRLLLENGSGWLAQLAPEEAGAAIERAGHRGDALRFYTVALPAADSSKQCAKLANERGIVCLERQLRSAEDEGRKKQAEDLRKEIAARRANAGLGLADKLPDYPKLDGLDALLAPPTLPAPSPQTPIPPAAAAISSGVAAPPVTSVTAPAPTATHIVCQVDDLRFELFRNSARLNIQHETTGKTASLHLRENRIESADVAFVPASDQPNVHTCADWSLRVDLSRLAGEAEADLYLDASGLLLRFSLKPN